MAQTRRCARCGREIGRLEGRVELRADAVMPYEAEARSMDGHARRRLSRRSLRLSGCCVCRECWPEWVREHRLDRAHGIEATDAGQA